MLALILLTAPAADPQYVVNNKVAAPFVVVNKTGCVCGSSCTCAPGVCPSCPAKAAPSGTLRTASGRLIRQTASGSYVYADEGETPQVLDCSSGKCKWVDAAKPAYLPDVVPATYSAPGVSGGCANGQCAAPQSFRPQPQFRRFVFPVK